MSSAAGSSVVLLRPTMASDLDAVVAIERDQQNLPFITPWDRTPLRFGARLMGNLLRAGHAGAT